MGKVKDFIEKHKPPKRTFKERMKAFFGYLKRPKFFIPCALTWLLLISPCIVGVILFFLTKENKYIIFASSYYAFTAPPLPIPVIPISIASGVFFEKILNKRKDKNENN